MAIKNLGQTKKTLERNLSDDEENFIMHEGKLQDQRLSKKKRFSTPDSRRHSSDTHSVNLEFSRSSISLNRNCDWMLSFLILEYTLRV